MILFKVLIKKLVKDERFTISEISNEFPEISSTFLYEIITNRLGYRNCSENAHGCAKNTQNDFGFNFL
jgi:hypothetical protein